MHQPVVIDNSDPDRLVYEQSDHNHQLCMQARFYFLENLFKYDDGKIVGLNHDFVWHDTDAYPHFCVYFILRMASFSRNTIAKFTNPDTFIRTIKAL
jgi:hypothetical protein